MPTMTETNVLASIDEAQKYLDLLPRYAEPLAHVPVDRFVRYMRYLVDRDHPEMLVRAVQRGNAPVATVCLFSGGHDSTVLAHQCRHLYDYLGYIDTGTALPGVRKFVEEFAAWIGKPLLAYEAGDAYRRMVLGGWQRPNGKEAQPLGFPGPGQHSRSYQMLKERQIEAMLRDLKAGHPRHARVVFLSGVRRDESKRRAQREPITRRWSAVFCNPLIHWTNAQMRAYRIEHSLPESDVAALMHRSGECNCGAYAKPGEREDIMQFYPSWWEREIAPLERELADMGHPHCRWGGRSAEPATGTAGPMCSDCQLRIDIAQEQLAA